MHTRLSLMMFLQFFIWGAWYVTVGNYMAAEGMAEWIHWAYTVNPIAAIAAPFFLGMVADRYFATEKVLGVLHLMGAAALIAAPLFHHSPALFVGLLLVHSLCYTPTLGLANALAFHHIAAADATGEAQQKQFPLIRVFGTLGWIVAGVLVSGVLHADESALPLHVAAAAAIVLGLYAFTLPHRAPPLAGQRASAREILGVDALRQLSSRSFNVFIASSLLISIPLAAYYAYAPVFVNAAGLDSPAFRMSFGQMSEVVFMLAMPLFFARLGVKWMLLVGMLAWVTRYALFALAAPDGVVWMIMAGILLHGICYDFFFVSGQIYVDKKSPPSIRGQAQGFLVLVTYGVGMLIGTQIAGWVFNNVVSADAGAGSLEQWRTFWWIPAAFAFAVALFFAFAFHDRVDRRILTDTAAVDAPVAKP